MKWLKEPKGEDDVTQKLGAAITQIESHEPKFTVDASRGVY